jgi:2,3,4,5-tetrahydropyridine-2-carboxylate N-succinyltransferase
MTQQLQNIIDQAWEDRANINPANGAPNCATPCRT